MKSSPFCGITRCSPLKVSRHFQEYIASIFRVEENSKQDKKFCLSPAFTLLSCLTYSSTLEMEAACSETSIDFQRTTCRYTPEDRTLLQPRDLYNAFKYYPLTFTPSFSRCLLFPFYWSQFHKHFQSTSILPQTEIVKESIILYMLPPFLSGR
jgi:hypothetical protein